MTKRVLSLGPWESVDGCEVARTGEQSIVAIFLGENPKPGKPWVLWSELPVDDLLSTTTYFATARQALTFADTTLARGGCTLEGESFAEREKTAVEFLRGMVFRSEDDRLATLLRLEYWDGGIPCWTGLVQVPGQAERVTMGVELPSAKLTFIGCDPAFALRSVVEGYGMAPGDAPAHGFARTNDGAFRVDASRIGDGSTLGSRRVVDLTDPANLRTGMVFEIPSAGTTERIAYGDAETAERLAGPARGGIQLSAWFNHWLAGGVERGGYLFVGMDRRFSAAEDLARFSCGDSSVIGGWASIAKSCTLPVGHGGPEHQDLAVGVRWRVQPA